MNWGQQFWLYCDNHLETGRDWCEVNTEPHFTKKECKQEAVRNGWLVHKGRVLCAECLKRAKQEGESE